MILLDTHVLIWLDEGNENLGGSAKNKADEALRANELFVNAVSFWEIGMLLQKNRLELTINLENWRNQLLENGLQELPLTGDMAILAAGLEEFHGDPADRFITASAVHTGMHLCTADKRILSWGLDVPCIDARK